MFAQLATAQSGMDVEYMQALYFPETSEAARVPTRFGMPSSVFT